MATYYSSWLKRSGVNVCRTVIEVSVTSETETAATVKLVTKIQYGGLNVWPTELATSLGIATGINGSSSTASGNVSYARGGTQVLSTRTLSITKTHAKQSIAVSGTVTVSYRGSSQQVAMEASGTQAVSAKTSYAVKFNANGGETDGMPASQAKWHGETLTLSSTVPKRPGCTFLGWNTKNDGSGTHYAAGATYGTNAALTLYAVWIGAAVDTITVFRCLQDGSFDDENGVYGHVDATWQAIGTLAGTVAVTSRYCATGGSWSTITLEGDTSGSKAKRSDASGQVSATFGGSLIRNKTYQVQVTVTLQCTYNGATETKVVTINAYIAVAYSTLEGFAGGRGVAMGKAAHRDGLDVAFEDIYFAGVPKHDSDGMTSSIAKIIAAGSDVSITYARLYRWGKLAMLQINWSYANAVTVDSLGQLTTITIGTLVEGMRPALQCVGQGYSAKGTRYTIDTSGAVKLQSVDGTGTSKSYAAGTFSDRCYALFVLS